MKTVLIVDDEFDLTSTLRAILEHNGYRVEICSDAREALESLRAGCPDLLLLDVMIPLSSGYDVLDRIRGEPGLAELPVVLMNAVPPPGGRPVRWQEFLRKPLSIPVLLGTIARLVGTEGVGSR